ncbi:hypothetical protein NSQ62_08095 [Solibacillus sp. FSL H8-0523]|uniref:hypothetical protein n=1 Tax=Solibacillus sp. FSL H8-0523 TaxID=2954511 RepID=UPI0031015A99
MKEQLQAIIIHKKKELLRTNPLIVDYPVLSEEIKDAEYALENIDNNDALDNVRLSTTSRSIYDLLNEHFLRLNMSKAVEMLQLSIGELDDAISFMELFDKDSLGDENRLQNKHDAMEKASAFITEYVKNNGLKPTKGEL